jgi:hypothetical protein
MNYRTQLHPWTIIRQLPQMQRVVVRRFGRRSDAENYLIALRRLNPQAVLVLIFDPTVFNIQK